MGSDFTPWPEGTLVMAVTESGLPLLRKCKGHIFKLTSPPIAVEGYTECGFIQASKCLVCNEAHPALDADFFMKKADGMDYAGMCGELLETIDWYQKVIHEVGMMMTGQAPTTMKDFG
jgi:hypothetical protein